MTQRFHSRARIPKKFFSWVPSGMCEDARSPIVSRRWGVGGSLVYHHQGSAEHSVAGTPRGLEAEWLETETGYTHSGAGGS